MSFVINDLKFGTPDSNYRQIKKSLKTAKTPFAPF